MSETLPNNGGAGNDAWNSLSNDENIEKIDDIQQSLEDGENPETVLRKAYEDGLLTPDFIDQYGQSLIANGLDPDKLDKYAELARQVKKLRRNPPTADGIDYLLIVTPKEA